MAKMNAETAELTQSGFLGTVPFARTLGVAFDDIDFGRAVMRLADRPEHHDHLASPHAGALFTLAESAAGAVVLGSFGDQLGRAFPVVVSVEARYDRSAVGDVTAEAVLARPREEILAELDEGRNPEIPLDVELRDGGGVVGRVRVTSTLRLQSR
ncbi:DUF4442 domain-containing protein [Nocardiopsis algeriensis]|uniref:Acyl-coenzyme A thioesterase PaaI-like protein n=1 Tax=Nocardiopsis algeriensis TaxID=1478215 RepID=A0A841IT33_9ACTN|nr:DUF4442 domain-containing protein [Nocardiopsis algeriensis]MBB6122049.1 acyl-coenzyme A thioesterase PaaI-like protein [Nocardiopsis algeriensis]